jgi:signal transduction histidine kinase
MVARRSLTDSADAPTVEALEEALAERSAKIEELLAKINEIESDRTDFLSDATHAIGNPLTVIHSYLEILHTELHEGLTEQQRSFVGIAYENANRLRRLVDDLVAIAALDTGNAPIDLAPYAADRIISSVCSGMQPIAVRRNQDLTTRIADDLPQVHVDADRLKDVLNRLIGNAMRFTPDGGSISVSARAEPKSVVIVVRDTGAGMTQEGADDALHTFVQLHRKPGESREGFGLGLPLCQRQVEAMGGTLTLESVEGQGTTVTVRFPVSPQK